MRIRQSAPCLTALAAFCVLATGAGAQQRDTTARNRGARIQTNSPLSPNRDVILEIPELSVDSIGLTVSNVRAHVALDANAMNFVTLTAGVDVGIKQVQLGITGVLAEAYLYVDLDNVARIVDRVVTTLDRNPQILTRLLQAVDTTVNAATGRTPSSSGGATTTTRPRTPSASGGTGSSGTTTPGTPPGEAADDAARAAPPED